MQFLPTVGRNCIKNELTAADPGERLRAVGRRGSGDGDNVEMIDVAADMPEWHTSWSAAATPESPRPTRRAWAAAAVSLVVVAGAGAALSVGDDEPTAAPPPTPSASTPPSSQPTASAAPTTTQPVFRNVAVPQDAVVPMVADPPPGWSWDSAFESEAADAAGQVTTFFRDALTNDWFMLAAMPSQLLSPYGDERIVLADGRIALLGDTDEVLSAATLDGDIGYQLFGMVSVDEAASILAGAQLVNNRPDATSVPSRFEQLSRTFTPAGSDPLRSTVFASMSFRALDDSAYITLFTQPELAPGQQNVWEFLLTEFRADDGLRWGVDLGGVPTVLVPMVNQTVFVSGNAPIDVLLDVAANLRPATPNEWAKLVSYAYAADQTPPPGWLDGPPQVLTLDPVRVGATTIEPSLQVSPAYASLVFGSTFIDAQLTDRPQLVRESSFDTTAVLAVAPAGFVGTLRVTVAGNDRTPIVEVPLDAVSADWPYVMATHYFAELGAVTAVIVDANGTVVAELE